MAITIEKAPAIASALLTLRGETQAMLSKKSGIRVANLSVWLRGLKDQVISQKRVVALLECLGIEDGNLKKYAVHNWSVGGNLDPLKFVLNELVDEENRERVMFISEQNSIGRPASVMFVPIKKQLALVKINAASGLTGSVTLNRETIGFGQFFMTPNSIPNWPDSAWEQPEKAEALRAQLDACEQFLLEEIRRDEETRELNNAELIDFVIQHLPKSAQANRSRNPGYDALLSVLKRVVTNGQKAKEIADYIAREYPE